GADGTRGHCQTRKDLTQLCDDLGVGHRTSESDVVLADVPPTQVGDPGQVEDDLWSVLVEVQLDHHVGAAAQRHRRGVFALGGERLGPGVRRQELHCCSSQVALARPDRCCLDHTSTAWLPVSPTETAATNFWRFPHGRLYVSPMLLR